MPADAAKPAWLGSGVAIFQSLSLFLATSTLQRLEEDVQHLAISAHSLSRGSTTGSQYPVSGIRRGHGTIRRSTARTLQTDHFRNGSWLCENAKTLDRN